MLKVFCRLNLLVVMESADCDKLMLRFLKNSKPPVEVGSLEKKERKEDTSCIIKKQQHDDKVSGLQDQVCCKLFTCVVGVGGGVSISPEPMALRNRIMCRQRSHLPCSSAVLNRRVACCLLTAGTSMFFSDRDENRIIHAYKKVTEWGNAVLSAGVATCSIIR